MKKKEREAKSQGLQGKEDVSGMQEWQLDSVLLKKDAVLLVSSPENI